MAAVEACFPEVPRQLRQAQAGQRPGEGAQGRPGRKGRRRPARPLRAHAGPGRGGLPALNEPGKSSLETLHRICLTLP